MNDKEYLYAEIKNFLVNVGWTHKIQICQSNLYIEKAKQIQVLKIFLTSLTSAGLGCFVLDLLPQQ